MPGGTETHLFPCQRTGRHISSPSKEPVDQVPETHLYSSQKLGSAKSPSSTVVELDLGAAEARETQELQSARASASQERKGNSNCEIFVILCTQECWQYLVCALHSSSQAHRLPTTFASALVVCCFFARSCPYIHSLAALRQVEQARSGTLLRRTSTLLPR